MAAIRKLKNGRWVAVHSITGVRLRGQSPGGSTRARAVTKARRAACTFVGRCGLFAPKVFVCRRKQT